MNWPSAVEREQIERALEGKEVHKLTIVVEKGSPWLRVDAWIWMRGDYRMALLRATGAVYELDRFGAVKEPSIMPPRWSIANLGDQTVRPDDSPAYNPDDPELMGKA